MRRSPRFLVIVAASVAITAGGGLHAADTPDAASATDLPAISEPVVGVLQPDAARWSKLSVVDTRRFPWYPASADPLRTGWRSKVFFKGPKVGRLMLIIYPPTFDSKMPPPGVPPHYHLWHEWGYTLKGDAVMTEPVSPLQKNGMLYHKKEGGWLSRPPYSLHAGTWVTGGLRNQMPYHLLLMEEGDGSIIMVGPQGRHILPESPGVRPDPYDPDWRAVKEWRRPWLVDSIADLEWEDDPDVPGRFVKWLSEEDGFRARLIKIPAGWVAPPAPNRTYYEQANVLRYVVYGDMTVWAFDDPADPGRAWRVGEDGFIYQPPRSLWGYGPGKVSALGAIWLEVTYAKGLTVGGGRIEAVKRAP